MSNKLIERCHEIEADFQLLQEMAAKNNIPLEVIRERTADLAAKQADLKKTVLHLIALFKIRDEALQALAYGQDAR